ncbi:unnamed protein product, partial [Pelagomonas calceolata]
AAATGAAAARPAARRRCRPCLSLLFRHYRSCFGSFGSRAACSRAKSKGPGKALRRGCGAARTARGAALQLYQYPGDADKARDCYAAQATGKTRRRPN